MRVWSLRHHAHPQPRVQVRAQRDSTVIRGTISTPGPTYVYSLWHHPKTVYVIPGGDYVYDRKKVLLLKRWGGGQGGQTAGG